MINKKLIDVNSKYYIKITYNMGATRLYRLIDKDTERTVVESYNRDSFLLKCRTVTRLSNNIELIVASV